MNILVSIGGDNKVAMTAEQLAQLNQLLAETPKVDPYNNDKIAEKERIKLEAVLTIKTRSYTVA